MHTLWKSLFRLIRETKARFISLFLLMTLGSFALVGLKAAGPDLEQTGNAFIRRHRVADVMVLANQGFSELEKERLAHLDKVDMSYSRVLEATMGHKGKQAIRLFQKPSQQSLFQLTAGRLPQMKTEVALAPWLEKQYPLGSSISLKPQTHGTLRYRDYKVVGFAYSSEIWSKTNLGASTQGDGNLKAYAVLSKEAFQMPENMVRISYQDLAPLGGFTKAYKMQLQKHQADLDQKLKTLTQEAKQRQQEVLQQTKDNKKIGKERFLESPRFTSFNRMTLAGSEGYQSYDTAIRSIQMIGQIFPLVLYIVAALVTFTTISRYVDEERLNLGLLLAMGYSKQATGMTVITYGFLASFWGSLLGIIGGTYYLADLIADIIVKPLGLGQVSLVFDVSSAALTLVFAMVAAVLPAFLVVRQTLLARPAQLLVPKPPTKGAKVFLEYWPWLWGKLSFTQKVTTRNMLRSKKRMMMTLLGVAGSVTLMYAGLGIQASLSSMVKQQFHQLTPYDLLVFVKKQRQTRDFKRLENTLESSAIADKQEVRISQLQVTIDGQTNKQAVTILVSPNVSLHPFIGLYDARFGQRLRVPERGILLSDLLAKAYQVKEGQMLTIADDQGQTYQARVAGIIDMKVGHYIVVSQGYYQHVFAQFPIEDGYFLQLQSRRASAIKAAASTLLKEPAVSHVSQQLTLRRSVEATVRSLRHIMILLVVLATVLALVILYNLTAINMAERARELSTLKVLGFYDGEVTFYIYRETLVLTGLGILLGLLGGWGLHRLIMTQLGTESMQFGHAIAGYVLALPILTICLVVASLAFWVHYQLKRMDMLEALKSVD
ncbi:ABC transporter permease [Streptococcus halichoeri]|uniref:ABC transporter permease n=1 Tax=Streptococcus halichoeri TaxID=254785 RepID=UPI00135765D0|nr:ABC transporter permease [Streptococcus halichoeri]